MGVALLAFQIVMIGVARVHPMRYFCWAPHDAQNAYEIRVVVDDRALSDSEIWDRYRHGSKGINPRTIYEVTDIVSHVEREYRNEENAQVTITYSVNGGSERQWHWPARSGESTTSS